MEANLQKLTMKASWLIPVNLPVFPAGGGEKSLNIWRLPGKAVIRLTIACGLADFPAALLGNADSHSPRDSCG